MRISSIISHLKLVTLTAACITATSVHALEWLSVQVPAPYENALTIPDHIRKDCIGLEKTVGIEVAYQLEKAGFAKIDRVERVNLKAPGKLLTLAITQTAASKGQWTDPKSLTVKAELYDNGHSFEWVTKSHTSRSENDVCETMEKNAVDIAKDIYKWLITTVNSKTLPANLSTEQTTANSTTALRQLQSRNLWISTNVQYATDAERPRIINDCTVDTTLIDQAMATFSKALSPKQIKKIGDAGADDDVLQFTVVSIKGSIDDAPIASRKLLLKAELIRNGVVIDTFEGKHSSEKGGAFGQVLRNTCDAFNDISKTMSADTYQWYVKRNITAAKQPDSIASDAVTK